MEKLGHIFLGTTFLFAWTEIGVIKLFISSPTPLTNYFSLIGPESAHLLTRVYTSRLLEGAPLALAWDIFSIFTHKYCANLENLPRTTLAYLSAASMKEKNGFFLMRSTPGVVFTKLFFFVTY